jgi:hypothetical protein
LQHQAESEDEVVDYIMEKFPRLVVQIWQLIQNRAKKLEEDLSKLKKIVYPSCKA